MIFGVSSTYYHRELIEYPQVDYVLRGDSTEPPLHQLLLALRDGAPLQAIPNLSWKENGAARHNPHTFIPPSLDYVDLRPDLMVDMVLRYRDLESALPFNGWWSNPITTVFTVKGCSYECVTCGSSQTTCTHLTRRQRPVYRSPASLVANVEAFGRLIADPIVLIGDLLQPEPTTPGRSSNGCAHRRVPNEVVVELFRAADLVSARRSIARAALEHRVHREPRPWRCAMRRRARWTTALPTWRTFFARRCRGAARCVFHDRPAQQDDG